MPNPNSVSFVRLAETALIEQIDSYQSVLLSRGDG